MEKIINELYREIAETVDAMIPEEWGIFSFYAQISDDGGGTYFYYSPSQEAENYKYSLDIPDNYHIDEKEFKIKRRNLFSLARELREVFKNNEQELWYSFTLTLERTGKLKVNFDYTDWFKTDYSYSDQLIIWEYKYLSAMPKDAKGQQLIVRYLEEYPNNPI
ncbi:antitoxin YezG family protein [Paenibacillus sp. NPDC058071]|uniref:antitoxin YezG family protein n=1 Tax=Paenibacillus sp. NPDC058071 TaxID=3346326 RepID=UPI0036DF590F